MDDAWEREANGESPSFQEFLAAEALEREHFLDAYMQSRGLTADTMDRSVLAEFLQRAGYAGLDSPAQAERMLDALLRVRPERVTRGGRGTYGHTA